MPNRDEILANIGEALAGINGSLRYNTALAAVGTTLATYDELGTSQIPWIGYWPTEGSPPPIAYPFGDEMHVLEVQLLGVVSATVDTRSARLAELERDIRTALYADRSRGGWAIDTLIASAPVTDEGDPDKGGMNANRATLGLTVRCTFFPDDDRS